MSEISLSDIESASGMRHSKRGRVDREFIRAYLHQPGVANRFVNVLINITASECDWHTAEELAKLLHEDEQARSTSNNGTQ